MVKGSHVYRRRFCSIKCKAEFQKNLRPWNFGLSKETDKRVKKYSLSGSKTIKKQFQNGRTKPKGMTGKKHTAKHILWLKQRFAGKNNPFYGKSHSRKTRQKIRLSVIKNEILGNKRFSFTKPERTFYEALDKRKITYIPQYLLNNKFVVDAYLPDLNTLIQVDGDYWHNLERVQKKDKSFNAYAKKCGFKVARFWEHEIYKNVNKCIDSL